MDPKGSQIELDLWVGLATFISFSPDVSLICSQRPPVLETFHFPHCSSASVLLLLKVSPKI